MVHFLKYNHFQISLDFCDRWAKNYRKKPSIRCFGEAHWSVATKETRINGLPQITIWKAFPRHNSLLIGRKNQAKFDDCISRNGHKIKITQPNLMILVSFSSAEDALSNDVKNITLLARKVLKIRCSAFLGDTRKRRQAS